MSNTAKNYPGTAADEDIVDPPAEEVYFIPTSLMLLVFSFLDCTHSSRDELELSMEKKEHQKIFLWEP